MDRTSAMTILEDDFVTLAHAGFCSVPGYLVLRLRKDVESFGDLSTPGAQRLGGLLASAAAAIETAVGAERVYCLSFCEVDRRLHFHLFPRTEGLLAAYREATGAPEAPVDGPALFQWARENFPADRPTPAGWPKIATICADLRTVLGVA